MIRQEIKKILKDATGVVLKVEYPLNSEHGDYASNVTRLLPELKPTDVVKRLNKFQVSSFKFQESNGFINFYLSKDYLQSQVSEILKQGDKYGQVHPPKAKAFRRVNIEFISANPTGPLTLGNGRGGFCGDVLANVLEKAGYGVEREYYVNDRGGQIRMLGRSVIGPGKAACPVRSEQSELSNGVYKGDYIEEIRKKLKPKKADKPEEVGQEAAKHILNKMIKPTIKRMGIKFDKWFSESELYKKKKAAGAIEEFKKKDLIYEKDGALWFRSTKFKEIGDDKDRVVVKADGQETYLASDIAYAKDKFDRGFDKLIYFWGADHHGYVKRLQAVVQALGYKKEQAVFIVMQLVRLFRDGKEVRMSKRAGVYITLDELFDELCQNNPLGMDAARWFFLSRQANTHLNFDLDLAKEQSEKNPVYYVQYASARMAGILANLKSENLNLKFSSKNLKLLNHSSELALIKQLIKLPEVIEDTASDYQVQRLPKYARDLAASFHKFYTTCRVVDEAKSDLSQARLALVKASQIALKNTLNLMGIKAPEKM